MRFVSTLLAVASVVSCVKGYWLGDIPRKRGLFMRMRLPKMLTDDRSGVCSVCRITQLSSLSQCEGLRRKGWVLLLRLAKELSTREALTKTGDGVTDDTAAINAAINAGNPCNRNCVSCDLKSLQGWPL
jgi:glucan 1,3-beta-glucosidase